MSSGLDSSPLVCIYRQYDGYLDGHGKDLRDGFGSTEVVNGIRVGDINPIANGMGCLAAQIVTMLKKKPGGVYIASHDADDEEFTYTIYTTEESFPEYGIGDIYVKIDRLDDEIYDGPLSDMPMKIPCDE